MNSQTFDRQALLRRDPGQVGQSLSRLPDQLRDGWRQARRVKLPASYRAIDRVAICGMGGSHLAADILRHALAEQLTVPVEIVADYILPRWVNPKTLVIASSYSGGTEETLAALTSARRRQAKIVVITSGGKLATLARRWRLPLYHYQPTENPSGQPRLGVAYGMMALLACWRSLRLISISPADIQELSAVAWEAVRRYGPQQPVNRNVAKQLAMSWQKSVPLLIGAEWTAGNLHTWANQINENAKTFAAWYLLPDLNHHLLEGLRNRTLTKQLKAVMVIDDTYHRHTQRRFVLTAKILNQLGASVAIWKPHGTTRLEKAIDLLAFGGYVSWYLAAARHVKPAPIPTVDWLKTQLAKR